MTGTSQGLDTVSADHPDVAIVGAGAAGLAAAIFIKQINPRVRVALLEGARRPGAKILVSGGSRCNVTNTVVSETDFSGGRSTIVRRVLRALPVPATLEFFRQLGVPLHEEPGGKLFPDSNQSRDVLDALLREGERLGVALKTGHRVLEVVSTGAAFHIATSQGGVTARAVVLATGGLSLPKTGSDGVGYGIAQRLGHTVVPTTPALVPLIFEKDHIEGTTCELSGVAQHARLDVWIDGSVAKRISGSLLWTHFGVSGPAALDASRHWLRARLEGGDVQVTVCLCPVDRFETLDEKWVTLARTRPRASLQTTLSSVVPASVASVLLRHVKVPGDRILAELPRAERHTLVHAMLAWPLPIAASRGYNYAEVTAGGVDLTEINPSTMESRVRPGLYLIGEILDVDGRIGGFNFQWAWSSARVAAGALARHFENLELLRH